MQFTESLTDRQAADVVRARIDWDNEQVQCPQGSASAHWYTYGDTVRVAFSLADCTRGQKRMLAFPTHARFEALWERREAQQTEAFRKRYNKRAGVEGTISQGAFALGMRHSRYRGLDKNHLQNQLTAMAGNEPDTLAQLDQPRAAAHHRHITLCVSRCLKAFEFANNIHPTICTTQHTTNRDHDNIQQFVGTTTTHSRVRQVAKALFYTRTDFC